jgi:signal transduction histidine kinase
VAASRADKWKVTGLAERRRFERRMTYIRWAGVAGAAVAVSAESSFPSVASERGAWVTIVLLAAANFALRQGIGPHAKGRDLERLGLAGFALDTVALMAFAWITAHDTPYVTWALLLLVPVEGALRFRFRGAAGGAVAVALFFIPQGLHRAHLANDGFDATTYLFIVGLATLLALVTGSMAESWYAQIVAFERQSHKLAEVDRLKDRFLAITSHEIRGPLTAIITGVDTVWKRANRINDDQRDRLLEMVSGQAHHLARLVEDLMVTSHLQAGKLTLQAEWTELEGAVRKALESAAARRRAHRLEVFIEPLRVCVDASRIDQVIRNLVENAYKYTPDKTRVAVTARSTKDGISIEIADEGPGIPPQQRSALFEAFSRIEETSTGQEGVGLGLFVVSQIVAAMDGHIDLVSSSRGTAFTISIPCSTQPLSGRHLGLVGEAGRQPRTG